MVIMAKFIVFYQRLLNGKIDTCIGGDSEIKADGRLSINTIVNKVFDQYYQIPKEAIGFKIHIGTNHLNHKPCTRFYQLVFNIKYEL